MFFIGILYNIFLLILINWLATFLVVFLHELGHLAMYFIFAPKSISRNWSLSIGVGRTFVKTKHFAFKILPFSGCFSGSNIEEFKVIQKIMLLLGGNLIVFIYMLVVYFLNHSISYDNSVCSRILEYFLSTSFWISLISVILSTIPIDVKFFSLPTDGFQIVSI